VEESVFSVVGVGSKGGLKSHVSICKASPRNIHTQVVK